MRDMVQDGACLQGLSRQIWVTVGDTRASPRFWETLGGSAGDHQLAKESKRRRSASLGACQISAPMPAQDSIPTINTALQTVQRLCLCLYHGLCPLLG